MSAPVADQRTLREVFGRFPSGLVTVAALGDDGRPQGLLVASFTSVSLDPALVSVSIGRSSSTLPLLTGAARWGLSVLADHQRAVADRFRLPSDQRFGGLAWTAGEDGAVHLDGAVTTLTVAPVDFIPAGDHVIAILALTDFSTLAAPGGTPLIFHRSRFHRLEQEHLS